GFSNRGGGIRNSGATLTVNRSTVSGSSGTGISNTNYLTPGSAYVVLGTTSVNDCTILGNVSTQGGGLFNEGTMTVTNTLLSGNIARSFNLSPFGFASGGAILNFGTLQVSGSTLSGNYVTARDIARGGGIYNSGTATINNTTLAGNFAGSAPGLGFLSSLK